MGRQLNQKTLGVIGLGQVGGVASLIRRVYLPADGRMRLGQETECVQTTTGQDCPPCRRGTPFVAS